MFADADEYKIQHALFHASMGNTAPLTRIRNADRKARRAGIKIPYRRWKMLLPSDCERFDRNLKGAMRYAEKYVKRGRELLVNPELQETIEGKHDMGVYDDL